jgi:uncharacterized damage-inducible protein DinB
MLSRPDEQEYDSYFQRYISLVPEGNFLELFGMQTQETRDFFEKLSEETGNYSYAPGKWSIKEVLGHVMDSERVFAYRTLCIARGEQQPLPGFDQNTYAAVAGYDRISLSKVLQHYTALRVSTFFLLEQIPDEAWTRTGISNEKPISLRALAYIIAGHERHHMRVISEKYGQQTAPLPN